MFHARAPRHPRDTKRGIDYVPTQLASEHVRASAAIPALFPAVRLEHPARARGWYFDGGTRLNTPIKPALALGADRVVVIGLNAIAARRGRPGGEAPDLLEGAAQLIQAVLVDPLVNDVATLATQNQIVEGGTNVPDRRLIPYIFVAPRDADVIGRTAARVFNRHYASAPALLRAPDTAVLGRSGRRRPRRHARRAPQLPVLRARVRGRAAAAGPARRRALARPDPRRRAVANRVAAAGGVIGSPPAARHGVGQLISTTISELLSGSRNQNSGGTGSPMRLTSSSTSTPASFSSA